MILASRLPHKQIRGVAGRAPCIKGASQEFDSSLLLRFGPSEILTATEDNSCREFQQMGDFTVDLAASSKPLQSLALLPPRLWLEPHGRLDLHQRYPLQ